MFDGMTAMPQSTADYSLEKLALVISECSVLSLHNAMRTIQDASHDDLVRAAMLFDLGKLDCLPDFDVVLRLLTELKAELSKRPKWFWER